MKFKAIILFCLNYLIIYFLSAQEKKCYYSGDQIDPFTKKRKVGSESFVLYSSTKISDFYGGDPLTILASLKTAKFELAGLAINQDSVNYLFFMITWKNLDAGEYTSISFLFENDLTTTLSGSYPTQQFEDHNTYTFKYYDISEKQWNIFKSYPIKKIRIHYENKTFKDLEIKEKNRKHMMHATYCIDALNIPKKVSEKSKIQQDSSTTSLAITSIAEKNSNLQTKSAKNSIVSPSKLDSTTAKHEINSDSDNNIKLQAKPTINTNQEDTSTTTHEISNNAENQTNLSTKSSNNSKVFATTNTTSDQCKTPYIDYNAISEFTGEVNVYTFSPIYEKPDMYGSKQIGKAENEKVSIIKKENCKYYFVSSGASTGYLFVGWIKK